MLSCIKENLKLIQYLIERGADISIINKDGWNALHMAVREGHINVVKYLISVCNDEIIKSKTKNGRTLIHIAGKITFHYLVIESL